MKGSVPMDGKEKLLATILHWPYKVRQMNGAHGFWKLISRMTERRGPLLKAFIQSKVCCPTWPLIQDQGSCDHNWWIREFGNWLQDPGLALEHHRVLQPSIRPPRTSRLATMESLKAASFSRSLTSFRPSGTSHCQSSSSSLLWPAS